MPTLLELCSITDFERYPGASTLDAAGRDWVVSEIRAFSERAEQETNRLFYFEERTFTFDVYDRMSVIQLPAFGSRTGTAGSVAQVHESTDQDWDANSLTDPDSYVFDDRTGMLHRKHGSLWSEGPQSVRVKWTGGFGTDLTHVPRDLRAACVRQVAFWWQRRNSIGVASQGVQGGSFTVEAPGQLLPDVREVLDKYAIIGGW